jgi:hypothetical protein
MDPEDRYSASYKNGYPQDYQQNTQQLKQRPKQMTEQQKKQAMTNDLFGRLFAEMEAAIFRSDKNTSFKPKYPQYLSVKDEDKFFYLQNIEIILTSLEIFCKNKTEKAYLGFIGETILEEGAKIPPIQPEYLDSLEKAVGNLNRDDPVKQTAYHIIKSIRSNEISELPPRVYKLIKSLEEREKEVKYMLLNNKSSVVVPKYMSEVIQRKVQKELTDNPQDMSNSKISDHPIFDNREAPVVREERPPFM